MELFKQLLALAAQAFQAGEYEKAKKLFQRITDTFPLEFEPYSYLGLIAIKTNQPDAAIEYFLEAVRLKPDSPLNYTNLAGAYLQTNRIDEALLVAEKALVLNPDYSTALLSSGTALLTLDKIKEGIEKLKRFLTLNPNHIKDLVSLAERMLRDYRNKVAIAIYELILEINPKHLQARFCLCFAHLLFTYKDENEIAEARSKYENELLTLRDQCKQANLAELGHAASEVGFSQPFLLPYQGQDDCQLQALYGEITMRFMQACYPEWEKPLPLSKQKQGNRIRVGIVTGFLYGHSNWKTHIRGWIKEINHKDFEIYGYYTQQIYEDVFFEAKTYFDKLTWGPRKLEEYCTAILEDNLDILIFPEIGMDSMTMRLATQRLAPIQCTSWGHPETSGLPTIDFFLSSALMESSKGDAYYTEKLVRLSNLSIYYEPLKVPCLKRSRADFGLREEAVLYWCCQTFIKYLPQYDEVFVKIARAVPNAQLVFIENVPQIAAQFRKRLYTIFARFGLKADDYCVFLPRLSSREFDAATHLMDVFLDSIGWSGCNSTLESLAHDLPIVTLPGALMRSRHTSAILALMGLESDIATSLDDYLERAINLGRNPEKRFQMRENIAKNKQKVFCDKTAVRSLENFLRNVVG